MSGPFGGRAITPDGGSSRAEGETGRSRSSRPQRIVGILVLIATVGITGRLVVAELTAVRCYVDGIEVTCTDWSTPDVALDAAEVRPVPTPAPPLPEEEADAAADTRGHFADLLYSDLLPDLEASLPEGADVAVARVQRALAVFGWIVDVDGLLGPATGRALMEFQHANGLPVTGGIDEVTKDYLSSTDSSGVDAYLAAPLVVPPPAGSAPQLSEEEILARARAIADEPGFSWRDHGVSFAVGCSPHSAECAGGSYETGPKLILLSDGVYRDRSWFRYVVLHELAHAWQFNVRGWPEATDDLAGWGFSGMIGLEYAADCLAAAWGARYPASYWDCPADATEHMRGLFEASR